MTDTKPKSTALTQWDRIIVGIDPGTNVMGYGLIGVKGQRPAMIAMGVIRLSKFDSHYLRLGHIYSRVQGIIEEYLPDEMALEAPFFGKNVQSMLKLGRAQGVAMAAAIARDIAVSEYEPRKVKLSITGNGSASKEQVREMIRRILNIPVESLVPELDATDALAVALCHYYEQQKPAHGKSLSSWKEFIAKNPNRIKQ